MLGILSAIIYAASPSYTAMETPMNTAITTPIATASPTETHSPQLSSVTSSASSMVGAGIGGALIVIAIAAVAIRFKIISAQFNTTPTIATWTPGKRSNRVRIPDMDIYLNPRIMNSSRAQKMMSTSTPKSV